MSEVYLWEANGNLIITDDAPSSAPTVLIPQRREIEHSLNAADNLEPFFEVRTFQRVAHQVYRESGNLPLVERRK